MQGRLAALLLVCGAFTASAQTITASLEGIVQDTTGAVVVGAEARLRNAATSVETVVTTNERGRYLAPLLPVGEYSLTITAPGFKRVQRNGIILQVNQAARFDVTLDVGDMATAVDVVDQAPLLDASTASLGHVISGQGIQNLPLNERTPFALVMLVPGVTGSSNLNWMGANNFSVNGGRAGSNDFLLDGTSTSPTSDNINPVVLIPSTDAVQEFNVQTHNYSAEFGASGGAIVNLIFKSGGNRVRGTLSEFLRNSALDANNFFSNRNNIPLASFKRNQFGGTIGGPVVLPKLYNGRNKTFFFISYEGLRQNSASPLTATVPTEAQRAGDFSNKRNAAGQLVTIYDPLTSTRQPDGSYVRTPFPANRIPADRINVVARNLINYYPLPNRPGNQYTAVNNFIASGASRFVTDEVDAKVDHNISDRQRFFVRISRRKTDTPLASTFAASNLAEEFRLGEGGTRWPFHVWGGTVDYLLTATPNFITNVRFGSTRNLAFGIPRSYGFDPTTLGMPAYIRDNADALMMPAFNPEGYYLIGHGNTLGVGSPQMASEVHTLTGQNTWMRGAHALKFGGESRLMRNNSAQRGNATGSFQFNRTFTQGPATTQVSSTAGDGFATLLLGVGSGSMIKNFKVMSVQSLYYAGYVTDEWRLHSRLTLSLGVRYEATTPRTERYNRMEYFDTLVPSPLAGPSGIPSLRGGLVYTNEDKRTQFPIQHLFSPRFGFAYQTSKNMVLRGGFGMLYAQSPAGVGNTVGNLGFRADTQFYGSLDSGYTVANYISNPFPDGFTPISGSSLGLMTGIGSNVNGPQADVRNPYTENWNFGIQRTLPGDVRVEAIYVGSHGLHLGDNGHSLNQLDARHLTLGAGLMDRVPNPFYRLIPTGPLSTPTIFRRDLLRPFPQFTDVTSNFTTGATSIYHSFQLKVDKRLSNGLSLLAAYTNAKLIDTASQTNGNVGRNGTRQDAYNWALERSLSPMDVSQRLVTSFVYTLPFGKGLRYGTGWNSAVHAVLGGWQVNGITTLQRGQPLTLSAANSAGIGNPGTRPNNNGTSGVLSGPVHDRLDRYFNTGAFSQPPIYTFGTTGRALPNIRADGSRNFDMSLFKNFTPAEGWTVQFRAEAFNAFNTPQFSAAESNVSSQAFGRISSQANAPRQIQFGLKVLF